MAGACGQIKPLRLGGCRRPASDVQPKIMNGPEEHPVSGVCILGDLDATAALAGRLAPELKPGDVIGLSGPLGAGKTTLVRLVLRALGVRDEVPSPTFNLVLTYPSRIGEIWHFDLFRIENAEEVYELGVEEAFSEAVSLIEWPERMAGILSVSRLDLRLEPLDQGERRQLSWRAWGDVGARLAKALGEPTG